MLFSTVCEYALRALTHLAAHGGEGPVQVKQIAEAEDIPRHFLAKILNQLTYKGYVRAVRGPGGGFSLVNPAEETRVADIIESIDGFETIRRRCVLGLDTCQDHQPCPMHDAWKRYRETFLAHIDSVTLSDMSETLVRKRDHEPKSP
jgi:Rrf2 family protein